MCLRMICTRKHPSPLSGGVGDSSPHCEETVQKTPQIAPFFVNLIIIIIIIIILLLLLLAAAAAVVVVVVVVVVEAAAAVVVVAVAAVAVDSQKSVQPKTAQGCVPDGAAHSRLHLL